MRCAERAAVHLFVIYIGEYIRRVRAFLLRFMFKRVFIA